MKINSLVSLIIILFVMSCKKDNEDPTKMSATIDNKAWTAVVRVTELQTTSNLFVISGTSVTGEIFIVTIYGSETGTYALSADPPKAACLGTYKASATAAANDIYVSSSGKVTLSKVDKTAKIISGTFEFTLRKDLTGDTKSVTKGVFSNLSYIEKTQ
jgi:hypothetical protein